MDEAAATQDRFHDLSRCAQSGDPTATRRCRRDRALEFSAQSELCAARRQPTQRDVVRVLAREIDDTIGGFVIGQGTLCLILAAFYAAALFLLGLKHGLLIGIAAGLISFVPYLGSLGGLVISTCVAIAQFWPHWAVIWIVPAIFFVGQTLSDYLLSPYFVGRRVNLNPVWIMFALFAFGYLFGFVGLLIAVPLASAIGVLTRFALQRYYESFLYTAGPRAM